MCGGGPALAPERWDAFTSRVVPTTRRVLDLLARAHLHATFFVVGWIAERYPALVGEILDAGHDVGSHGYWHRRVYEMTPAEFAADLQQSANAIVAAGAPRPTSFRAPEWSINDRAPWALDVLTGEGFGVDASMAPLRMVGSVDYPRHPHVRHTGHGKIVEVPPLVADRFGQVMPMGWGWGLRMSSPRRVLETMARVNAAGHPAVLTLHPWEIDPDPPHIPLPPRLRFAHYFRLDGFERRLEEVVRQASFTTLPAVTSCVRV